MSRVLITGGAGIIGQAIVRRLLCDPDFEVRVCDQRACPSWIREGAEVRTGDLRDRDRATSAVAGVSHVVHCATVAGGTAGRHGLPYTRSALEGALCHSVIAAAVECGVERFVYISSSMVFERATVFPTPEEHLGDCLPPRSAYGFSQLAGEMSCRAAHAEFGLPYTICRPFSAYGPGEAHTDEPGISRLLADLIGKILAGRRPLAIFGSGEQTRTLTHVDDVAAGVVAAMRSPAGLGEDFNLSSREELTVERIARTVWEQCGEDPDAFELERLPSLPHDVPRRWPSVEKAARLLAWEAEIDLQEGIAATVARIRDRSGAPR